jgi:hypothetical protein
VDRFAAPVPSHPIALTAVAGAGSVTLSFVPPLLTGGNPVTGYEYSFDGGTTWHPLTVGALTGGRYSGTVTGLSGGHAYTFEVRALNIDGNGFASIDAAATPTGSATLPVTGTASGIVIVAAVLLLLLGRALRISGRTRQNRVA